MQDHLNTNMNGPIRDTTDKAIDFKIGHEFNELRSAITRYVVTESSNANSQGLGLHRGYGHLQADLVPEMLDRVITYCLDVGVTDADAISLKIRPVFEQQLKALGQSLGVSHQTPSSAGMTMRLILTFKAWVDAYCAGIPSRVLVAVERRRHIDRSSVPVPAPAARTEEIAKPEEEKTVSGLKVTDWATIIGVVLGALTLFVATAAWLRPREPQKNDSGNAASPPAAGVALGAGIEGVRSPPPPQQPLPQPKTQVPEPPAHPGHPHPRSVTPSANPEIAPTPKPSVGDPSVWSEIEKLSSTPQAAARREDSRILEEAYSRLVSAHLKVATSLKDFQPSNGAGGTPNLDSRKVEGIWATRRMGYDSPVFFTKYEIRISNGHLLFADKDAKASFYETPVGTPNYGDDFLAAVRRSMEPQIRAELRRATRKVSTRMRQPDWEFTVDSPRSTAVAPWVG